MYVESDLKQHCDDEGGCHLYDVLEPNVESLKTLGAFADFCRSLLSLVFKNKLPVPGEL